MRIGSTIVIAFGFYLLLAGALGTEQLVAAAAMAVIALGWSVLIRRSGSTRAFAFTIAHLRPWARALAALPSDTLRVGAVVAKAAVAGGSPGRIAQPAFRFGTTDDPCEAARRASAIVAGSLTPDTFVVAIRPGRGRADCHKLLDTPAPADADWLT